MDAITKALAMPWFKEWTGVEAKSRDENIKHVYDELTGKIDHSKLGWKPKGEFTPAHRKPQAASRKPFGDYSKPQAAGRKP